MFREQQGKQIMTKFGTKLVYVTRNKNGEQETISKEFYSDSHCADAIKFLTKVKNNVVGHYFEPLWVDA